jgi:hypothetical protein
VAEDLGGASARRRRLLSPATALEPKPDLAGTRLIFHFVFRVLYVRKLALFAILIAEQGLVCKKPNLTHI